MAICWLASDDVVGAHLNIHWRLPGEVRFGDRARHAAAGWRVELDLFASGLDIPGFGMDVIVSGLHVIDRLPRDQSMRDRCVRSV